MTTASDWRDPSPIALELNELVGLNASIEGRLTAITARICEHLPESRAEVIEPFIRRRIRAVVDILDCTHRDLELLPEHTADD